MHFAGAVDPAHRRRRADHRPGRRARRAASSCSATGAGPHASRDLKGKTVGVPASGPAARVSRSMLAHVGLDPRQDINWVTHPSAEVERLLDEGKIDAFMGFPPDPQELRARKIGHVVVNSNVDRPWSQYFCCMLAANREFVRKHPVATKRALRALLKAHRHLRRRARAGARAILVDSGFTGDYDVCAADAQGVPYDRWREYDPEDTVRFYALRLHEAGMIKSTPQKIIAAGTDWRFFNELKKELKGEADRAPPAAALVAARSARERRPASRTSRGARRRLPRSAPAPAFTLTTTDGAPSRSSDLRGKVVAVTFIYATCTDTCPLLTARWPASRRGSAPTSAARCAFVSITVDPERDTPEVLRRYAAGARRRPRGLGFLTGTPDEIQEVGAALRGRSRARRARRRRPHVPDLARRPRAARCASSTWAPLRSGRDAAGPARLLRESEAPRDCAGSPAAARRARAGAGPRQAARRVPRDRRAADHVGAVGLEVLTGVNRRAEDLVKLQRKIAAYRQLQHDTTGAALQRGLGAARARRADARGDAAPAQPVRLRPRPPAVRGQDEVELLGRACARTTRSSSRWSPGRRADPGRQGRRGPGAAARARPVRWPTGWSA